MPSVIDSNAAAPSVLPADPLPGDPLSADPLTALRDWHLPDPVSWWPPAPGWWLVAALLLGACLLMLRWWFRRHRTAAPARAALAELERLRARAAVEGDERGFAAAVSALLRRLALVRYPRDQVAGLTGTDWLAFLDRTGGGERFSTGPGRILGELLYRAPDRLQDGRPHASAAAMDAPALAQLAGDWIRAHRRPSS